MAALLFRPENPTAMVTPRTWVKRTREPSGSSGGGGDDNDDLDSNDSADDLDDDDDDDSPYEEATRSTHQSHWPPNGARRRVSSNNRNVPNHPFSSCRLPRVKYSGKPTARYGCPILSNGYSRFLQPIGKP